MKTKIFIFAISMIVSAPVYAAKLSGDEIRENLVGKRISFTTINGAKGTVRYKKNGSSKVNVKTNKLKDEGRWWIKGNTMCQQWSKIRDGKAECFSYTQIKRKTYKSNTGAILKVGF